MEKSGVEKFNGQNFYGWKIEMEALLEMAENTSRKHFKISLQRVESNTKRQTPTNHKKMVKWKEITEQSLR
jgi:hypothetical protein